MMTLKERPRPGARGRLRAGVFCVALASVPVSLSPAMAAGSEDSPVRISASVNREDYSQAEWEVLLERYDMVTGLKSPTFLPE